MSPAATIRPPAHSRTLPPRRRERPCVPQSGASGAREPWPHLRVHYPRARRRDQGAGRTSATRPRRPSPRRPPRWARASGRLPSSPRTRPSTWPRSGSRRRTRRLRIPRPRETSERIRTRSCRRW